MGVDDCDVFFVVGDEDVLVILPAIYERDVGVVLQRRY